MDNPLSSLAYLWRRFIHGGKGEVRPTERTHMVWEECRHNRYNEARLLALAEQFRDQVHPLSTVVETLMEDKHWDPAMTYCDEMIRRFPHLVVGYRSKMSCLRALGRNDESEKLALSMIKRFPRSPAGGEGYAYCATYRGDWVEAERRLAQARRRFPRVLHVNINHASVLARLGRPAEADEIAHEIVDMFPNDIAAWRLFGTMAEKAGDWPEAAARWGLVRDRYPGLAEFHGLCAKATRLSGRESDAKRLVDDALFVFPQDQALLAEREILRHLP